MLESSSFKGFACPYEGFDAQLFSEIVRDYAGSVMSLLYEKYGGALGVEEDALARALEYLSAAEYEGFLSPALGHCLAALKSHDPAAAQRGVAQVMLGLSCDGLPGSWSVELSEPASFHYDYFLLPEAGRVEVTSDGREARVVTRLGGRESVHDFAARPSGGWRGHGAPEIAHAETEGPAVLLLSRGDLERLRVPVSPVPPLEEITPTHALRISECIKSLDSYIPSCSSWVRRVLKYISLVESPPGHLHSGSFKGYFGLLYMTDIDDPLKTAEALIHEASHQYFSTLACLGEMVRDEGRLFYSPFVRMDRPPDRILFAYHAFANVEMFYRECLRGGVETAQCEKAVADMVPEVEAVERILLSEVELTDLGSSIFEPLLHRRSAYAASY